MPTADAAQAKSDKIHAIAFVVRCACAATLAYALASALGLPQAVWAAMSAVIVSQEQPQETRASLKGWIIGTLLGIGVTVLVSEAASRLAVPVAVQMMLDVALCAGIAHRFPSVRVAMWTCPIILLTAQPDVPIPIVAFHRASEVILGALVGGAFHAATEILVGRIARPRLSAE